MQIYGLNVLSAKEHAGAFQLKMIVNEDGAVLSIASVEHRDLTFGGLRYADDYSGNALAAMVYRGRIELRYHDSFSAERVASVVKKLSPHLPDWMNQNLVGTYQGNEILIS
ncbi:MAG: hypothetical protein Aurels2KO_47880 [Aureliella sp.]